MKAPGFTHTCLTLLLTEERSDFLKLVTPLDCADYPNLLEIDLVIMLTACSYFLSIWLFSHYLFMAPLFTAQMWIFFSRRVFSWGRTSPMSTSLCPVLWVLFHHVTARPVPWEPPSLWSLSPGCLISWVTFFSSASATALHVTTPTQSVFPLVFGFLTFLPIFCYQWAWDIKSSNAVLSLSLSYICLYLRLYLGQVHTLNILLLLVSCAALRAL